MKILNPRFAEMDLKKLLLIKHFLKSHNSVEKKG